MNNQNKKCVMVPEEIYERLVALASDLDFAHQNKVCVMPLLDAVSQIESEDLYELLRSNRLLP